ncbi:DMT family transporter [Savagea faecisuis]|uniref:DMT family transporter n=1 Tax=Savagea faecisuis TaxID=1274803 RepID=A0ABW3GT59_9BACL
MSRMAKVYAITVLVMFIWGMNLPLLKYLLTYVGPITLTGFRILLAAISVFVILSVMGLVRLPRGKEWLYIAGGALLNVTIHHYFLNVGLTQTSGTSAGLILGTGPVLTAVLTALILRNYPSRLQWVGVAFGFVGVSSVTLLNGGEFTGLSMADSFIFIAILTQVLSFLIIAKAARTLDPRLLTGYMLLIGSIILIVLGFIQEPGEWRVMLETPPKFWLGFAVSGIVGTAVGHMLYNAAVGEIGPTKAAIFINLNTLFSLLGSVVFLGETLTVRHLFAFVLIIIGVILGSGAAQDLWKSKKQKREEMERTT